MTESDNFICKCCGECCRGEMRVYLNPQDLFLIACFMKVKHTRHLFERNIVVIDYERNRAPVPRLRFSKGPAGCCPFLENRMDEADGSYSLSGLCRLHPEYKPLVCILAPFYRTLDLDTGTEVRGFQPPLPGCPGCCGEGDSGNKLPGFSKQIEDRLESERLFFNRLSCMLDENRNENEIVQTLYHFDINCPNNTKLGKMN